MIFYNEKTPSMAIKTRSSKSWEIEIFPKGLTGGFCPNMAIFSNIFFLGNCNISQENVFYDILEQKNAFLGCKSKKFKKSKNWHISKKVNSYIWSKNGHFANFSFWGNIKTRSLKSRKIDIFQNGLTHGFAPKMAIFPTFFFRKSSIGKCLLWYFRTKKRLSRL